MNGNEKSIAKRRNSSIELYRIIATFAVIIVHFNGWLAGGLPDMDSLANVSTPEICQIIIQSLTIICVNMFLLISGYFGITLKLESILKVILLLLFIKIPFYFVELFYGKSFSLTSFCGRFFVLTQAGYFVQCYLMLMFLSPVLNSFVEKYKKRILSWVFAFLFIEFWFGCIMNVENLGFNNGYSVIHFILIYLLARCLNLYKDNLIKLRCSLYWGGYFISTIALFLLYCYHLKWCFAYSNPVVVVSTVCTFVPFLYKDYYNRLINWIASSTFAVYILQVTHPVFDFLTETDQYLKAEYTYSLYWLLGIGIIICFFFFSVLYDKLCNLIMKPIIKRILLISDGRFYFSFK